MNLKDSNATKNIRNSIQQQETSEDIAEALTATF